MLGYALRRLLGILPTLLVIITVSFCVMRLAPGGPFDAEQTLPPPVRANLERAYGLDQPLAAAVSALPGASRARRLRAVAPSARLHRARADRHRPAAFGHPRTRRGAIGGAARDPGRGAGRDPARQRPRSRTMHSAHSAPWRLALPSFVVGPLLALIFGLTLGVAAGGRLGAREPALFSAAGRDARAARDGGAAAPRRAQVCSRCCAPAS